MQPRPPHRASRRENPRPPRPIEPLTSTLPKETALYRLHDRRIGGDQFNPGFGGRTRWAFFDTPSVPVLYAALSPEAAVFETLLHDAVAGSFIPAARYRTAVLSVLRSTQDLSLAQFHSAGLRKFDLSPEDLTSTSAETYTETVPWAAAVHADTDLAGIEWMPRQFNSVRCVVLFGDRCGHESVRQRDADAHEERNFATPTDQEWLASLAARMDVTLEV
jgi:RES domain-containing protein